MNFFYILAFCLMFAVGCNSSDFSGGSAARSIAKKPTAQKSGAPSDDGNDDNDDNEDDDEDEKEDDEDEDSDDADKDPDEEEIETDDAVKKVNCDDEVEKIDADGAPFSFTTTDQLRDFVNSRCKTGISSKFHGAGAVGSDAATATAVCNLKGYKKATVNETGKYSSPGDNFIAYWEAAQTKFILAGASGRNSKIKNLLCSEKFKAECHEEEKKVDCIF